MATPSSRSKTYPTLPTSTSTLRHDTPPSTSRARSSRTSIPSSPITSIKVTPTHYTHPHNADEVVIEEAARILHLTPAELMDGAVDVQGNRSESPRVLRHRKLNDARLAALAEAERFEREGSVSGESQTSGAGKTPTRGKQAIPTDTPSRARQPKPSEEIGDVIVVESPPKKHSRILPEPPVVPSSNPDTEAESNDESDDSTSDTTENDDEDEDESDTDSETDTSDEEEEDDDDHLEKLLQAAKLSAIAKSKALSESAPKMTTSGAVAENEDELRFDGDEVIDESERKKEAPIPGMTIPTLPSPHIKFNKDGTAKASINEIQIVQAGPSRHRSAGTGRPAPELDTRPYERELTKKEKAAMPKKATTSELWAAIPSPREDMLPQMKRDYQALALANSLDPKRFMKGGNKAGKVPERFAIGTMVEAPRHLRDTTQTTEKKYRPGQVVQSIVADQEIGTYAKRKYGDLQGTRMDNGRGKGWKKRSKW